MPRQKWAFRTAITTGALAAALLVPGAAFAAVITPNTTADEFNENPAACSLREAVESANTDSIANADGCTQGSGPDVINLAAGAIYQLTKPGQEGLNATGDLDIRLGDLTIEAPAGGATIDGNGLTTGDRVIEVANFAPPITVNFRNLTITDGGGPVAAPGISGGGLGVFGATQAHTVNIFNSTISGNRGIVGGGINDGTVGKLTLVNATVSGNSASVDGGGISNDGLFTMQNSTVTANTANADGDFIGGGGGIVANDDPVSLRNSIVAGNADGGQGAKEPECDGPAGLNSQGNNVIGVLDGCTYVAGANDQTGVASPGLLPLAANGGPVFTHALLADSPAIDRGAACEATDARGLPRTLGGTCDVGAYDRATCGNFGSKKPRVINVVGTEGADQLHGVHGGVADGIAGLGGNDTLKGLGAGDCILGGAGRDKLFGGDGKDQLFGGAGRDVLKGQNANDRLSGGKGKDKCLGGPGKKDRKKSCEKGKG